jgi:hypothetical protein
VAPMVMASHIGTGILLIVGNVIAGGCGERVGKVGEEVVGCCLQCLYVRKK